MPSKSMELSAVVKHKNAALKSKAVKAALVDGLLSDSATHIHMLLQSQDPQLMSDTMQQLSRSPRSIDAFLRTLADLAAKHPQTADRALHWLNRLMESHSGYIASSPDLTLRLASLRCQLQARLQSLQRLLMLKGRLDLLLSFQQAGAAAAARQLPPLLPATTHQERNSSDEDVTESEEDDGEGEEDGEGPDDLAGQLLGDDSSGDDAEGEEGEGAVEDDLVGSEDEDAEEDSDIDENEEDSGEEEDGFEDELSSSDEEAEPPAAKVSRRS